MSYYKNSYSAGDTFIDYNGNKYTVVTGGNTPSIPFDKSNIVSGNIVWGDIRLQEIESSGGGISNYTAGVAYSVGEVVIYNNKIYQCNTAHTSTSTFDSTKWTEISASSGGSEGVDTSDLNFLIAIRADSTGVIDLTGNTWTNTNVTNRDDGVLLRGKSCAYNGTNSLLTSNTVGYVNENEDFTLCFWFRNNSADKYYFGIISNIHSGDSWEIGNFNVCHISKNMSGLLRSVYKGYVDGITYDVGNESATRTDSLNFSIDTSTFYNGWHHYAITRRDGALHVFLDGVLKKRLTYSDYGGVNGQFGRSGQTVYIGKHTRTVDTTHTLYGSIDDLCLIKGTALWDKSFIPPKQYISYGINTQYMQTNLVYLLRLRADSGGPNDLANNTLTTSNIDVSNNGKFSGRSMYFDANNSYIYYTPTAPIEANEDFTVSLWYKIPYASFDSKYIGVINQYADGIGTVDSFLYATSYRPENSMELYLNNTRAIAVSSTDVSISTIYSNSVWHHYACTRHNNVIKIFVDGVELGTTTYSSEILSIDKNVNLMWNILTNYGVQGHLDDVCIIKGVALWADNFTPPTNYLPSYI